MAGKQALDGCSLVMRLLALLFCIASTLCLLKSNQTAASSLGTGTVYQSVKYSDSSGLIYLIFASALVGLYCFVYLVSSIPAALSTCSARKGGRWAIFIVDQMMAYVLLSAVSSATEVVYLSKNGFAKPSWEALCPSYGHFCRMLFASVGFSFVAVLLLVVISVMSARKLFRLYTRPLYAAKIRHTSLT